MCCSKGFLKRLVPFFLTFAVGLFIASFFVTIAAPRIFIRSREYRRNHQQYHQQIESENQRLKDENLRLRNQLSDKRFGDVDFQELKYQVPPVPPMPPAPPSVRAITVPRN